MKQIIPWNRFFAESLVIVSSILLAFAIEAWWEERNERELERGFLERLLQDQYANSEVISALQNQHAGTLVSARRIYPLIADGLDTGRELDSTIMDSYSASPSPSPTWVDDTFEELKSSGNIDLIQSSEIRMGLLEYYRYLDGADYTYEFMSTHYRDSVRSKIDPDVQLSIRTCGRRLRMEQQCNIDNSQWDAAGYVKWLTNNSDLADGLRRVIVQFSRAETEYLPYALELTNGLIEVIRQELARR